MQQQISILALASEFKGAEFIKECKAQGCHITVITRDEFAKHPWPHECIDAFHTMPDLRVQPDITHAVCYLMRHHHYHSIVALDDFDVEHVADIREHIRFPGMGHSQARLFRDKLAMRSKARELGIQEPDYISLVNHHQVHEFLQRNPAPWIFKPRTLAGAEGIQKFYQESDVWEHINVLGDQQSEFLIEAFIPGEVYHCDALWWQGEMIFSVVSKYGEPPLNMLQHQKLFSTRTLDAHDADSITLKSMNQQLLKGFGREHGPTHSEFIKAENNEFYFLETSARVAGGNIEKMLEASTGLKYWREAARMELASIKQQVYILPAVQNSYAALLATPIKNDSFDPSRFSDPGVYFSLLQDGYFCIVFRADTDMELQQKIKNYSERLLP